MSEHRLAADRDPSNALLLTVHATLRKVEVTPLGHLSCVLETQGQTFRALGDPIVADLVELYPGASLRAVLLRMRHARPEAEWHWRLMCCRAAPPDPVAEPTVCIHLPA